MQSVRKFYSQDGWKQIKDRTLDACLFEDLRPIAQEYISLCRKRVLKYIPKKGGKNILDFASGTIQYKEYLSYSKRFDIRHCVDFSKKAIIAAKKKIGKHGRFYCDDFNKIKFKENYFDCIISLHTIYHIKKNLQKKTILKLLNLAKPRSNVIIVYSNPNTLIDKLKKIINYKRQKPKIYFFCHNINWWMQFENLAYIQIKP